MLTHYENTDAVRLGDVRVEDMKAPAIAIPPPTLVAEMLEMLEMRVWTALERSAAGTAPMGALAGAAALSRGGDSCEGRRRATRGAGAACRRLFRVRARSSNVTTYGSLERSCGEY